MRKKNKLTKLLLVAIVVCITGVLFYNNFKPEKGIKILAWDNIYDENNINLYYEDNQTISSNENLQKLESTYKVKEIVSEENDEIKKVLKTVDILNTILDYDHIPDSNYNSAYEILKGKGTSKKVSGRDMAIIERDFLLTAGYISRVGEFRQEQPQYKTTSSYYVVEYYSTQYNKWVMIDFINRAYLSKDNVPISSIEMLNQNISNLSYEGKGKIKEYKKDIERYLSSYTIAIDNTLKSNKSNTYITFISNNKDIDLKKEDKFISPTIFTKEKQLFTKEPTINEIGEDSKAYLVMLKSAEDEKDNYQYVIGAFQNSSVINNYYLRIDNGDWQLVNTYYYKYDLSIGKCTIELSLDGKNVLSKIVIDREV